MALNVDKLEQNTSVTSTKTDGGSKATGSSKQPVNMNMKELAKNFGVKEEVLTYINSDEFKALSAEEQIKQLKEKYFPPKTDTSKIKEFLNTVKEALAAQQTDKKEETATPAAEADNADKNDNAEAKEEPKNQSEIETLAAAYNSKNGTNLNIDEIRSELLKKERTGELNEDEKTLLAKLQEGEKPENTEEKPKSFISVNELLSEEFLNKKPNKQLEIIEDAYFKANDEEYNKLTTDKQKKEYIEAHMADIMKTLGIKNNKSLTKGNVTDLLTLLQTAQNQGISLDELSKKDKTELNNIVTQSQQELLKAVYNRLSTEDLKNATGSEKAFALAKMLSQNDPEYQKLKTDKEKEEYINKKLNTFMNGIVEGFEDMEPNAKEPLYAAAFKLLGEAVNNGNLADLKNLNKADKLDTIASAIEQQENHDPKMVAGLRAQANILNELSAQGIENPSDIDIYNHLKSKGLKNLTPEERIIYNELDLRKKANRLKKDGNSFGSSIEAEAKVRQQKVKDTVNERLYLILNNKTLSPKQKEEQIRALYEQTRRLGGASYEAAEYIDNLLREEGYTDEQIKKIRPQGLYNDIQIGHMAKNEGVRAGKAALVAASTGTKAEAETATKLTQLAPGVLTNDQATKFGVEVYPNKRLQDSFNIGLADRTQVSKEKALDIHTGIMNSDRVSDADKATGTQSFILAVKVNGPEEQVFFGRELSKINNPAVTEGLAAASNSVDKQYRNQYNSYIEAAIKNYPPETQKTIRTAMTTGQISQATLAKTTPANTSSQTASTSYNTQAVSENKNTYQTSQTQTASQTMGTMPTSSNSTSSSVRSEGVGEDKTVQAASQTTQATGQTIGSTADALAYTTQQLEQQRNQAAQNAKQTSEDIKKSVDEYEAQKEISKTVDKIIDELGANDSISLTEKEKIKQQLMKAGSISEVYEIIASLGAKDLFIDRLVSRGSAYVISSFIRSIDDSSVLEQMYLKTSSDTVKKELLQKLPEDRIHALIASGKVQNLNDLDPKIIMSFILKNIGSMRIDDFKFYAKYLDKFDYNRLWTQYQQIHHLESEPEAGDIEGQNEPQPVQDTPVATNPVFKVGETRKTLADGRTIKPKETFAGVSNVLDETLYDVVPEEQDKTQMAMNDEVLTPGSDAWREKYGLFGTKNPQTTAFTFADMEKEAEETSSFPSAVVPNWKYKGKPKGINFKG